MARQTEEDVAREKRSWHWRNSMRPARFFGMDARAAIPFLVLLIYARPVTLILAISFTALFKYLENKGLTFPAALRAFRSWMVGQARPGMIGLRRRKMIDYG